MRGVAGAVGSAAAALLLPGVIGARGGLRYEAASGGEDCAGGGTVGCMARMRSSIELPEEVPSLDHQVPPPPAVRHSRTLPPRGHRGAIPAITPIPLPTNRTTRNR